MSRTISEVEATLRLTRAAPKMLVALDSVLPKIRERYEHMRAVALATEDPIDGKIADEWCMAMILCETALQEARDYRCVPRSVGVSEIRRIK